MCFFVCLAVVKVWGMLENLGFDERFHVYEAWRGYGMEKQGLGFKHPQYVVAEVSISISINVSS